MVMGLLPVVGIPLPLMSYGGTAMLTVMAAFGLIQCCNVHRETRLPRGF
jgi:rod shape determining protein RodA